MGFFSKNFNKQNFFAIAIIVILIFLMTQISAVAIKVGRISENNSSMIKEIGMVREANMSFGNDLNEVRKFLLLPTKDYFPAEEIASGEDESEQNSDKLQLQMFKYVEYVGNKGKIENMISTYKTFLEKLNTSESLKNYLSLNNLSIRVYSDSETSTFIAFGDKNSEYLKYYLDKETGKFFMKTVFEKTEKEFASYEDLEKDSIDFLTKNKERIAAKISEVLNFNNSVSDALAKEDIKNYLVAEKLTVSEGVKADSVTTYSIKNLNNENVGEISADEKELKISLVDLSDPKNKIIATELSTSLLPFLKNLNSMSGVVIAVDKAKESIDSVIKDEGFIMILKQNNLTVATEPTSDEDRYYYKITDKDGKHISSIVIEKATGVVNIVDPSGNNSENILFFNPEEKKKNSRTSN